MTRSLSVLLLVACLGTPYARAAAREPVVGDIIGELHFKDTRYLNRSLADFSERKAFVLVFTTTSCPLVSRYIPTLIRLEKEYRDKSVQFLAVNVGADDSIVAMAGQAVEYGVPFPFVKDFGGVCAKAIGVTRTPEVAVLDGKRRLVYRGRIDDQYRPGAARKEPTRHDLKEALEDVLAGRAVKVSQATVDGCLITFPEARKFEKTPTYREQVGPLLRKHCAGCHRPGTTAPFSLLNYEQAKTKAKAIAEVVRDGQMPPWFAAPNHGRFVNRRGLDALERDTILAWASAGAPEGKAAKGPKAEEEKDRAPKWAIGEPDVVVSTEEFELPAEGDVPYRYVILPYVFLADTWVQSIQILPDNPRVVHHANLAYVALGERFNEKNFLTGVVPGGEPMQLDDGTAVRLPGGSGLALQIHFVTTGKKEKCKLAVGLRYPRAVVHKQLRHMLFVDTRFKIPPGDPAHAVTVNRTLDRDVVGVGLFAHMHLRGKAMSFTAHPPSAKAETLLIIANYHFSWQIPYRWEPGKMKLPKGTRMECVALYDNSAFNPFNPDPKTTVRDGPQTYHEMMNGFFFFFDEKEDLNLTINPKTGTVRKEKAINSSRS
jgi:thiol-disulfide isomerase/thioredoxin